MQPVSVYKSSFTVNISDVDFTKHLKTSALFGYFQEIAGQAVDNLGIGIVALERDHGVAWALIRLRAEVERWPELGENLTIETWPQPPHPLEFERDYLVRDAAGRVVVRAVSVWVIFDLHSRRLRKSEYIAIEYPPFRTERAIDCRLGSLADYGQRERAYQKVVGYSDIDFNGHLNNARYIDFIMDCFPVEEHAHYCVQAMEVNYLNEAMPGDTLTLYRDVSKAAENHIYIDGVNDKDGKVSFRAAVTIRKREESPA